jgi:hypothetical protein
MRSNGGFLGKWITLAFFIESLMIAYIPAETIAGLVGTENVLAVPVSAVLGIPAYINGYAAIPLISGLMDPGMAPGAALSFVTAGAVSSIPAAMARACAPEKSGICRLYRCRPGRIGAGRIFLSVALKDDRLAIAWDDHLGQQAFRFHCPFQLAPPNQQTGFISEISSQC